MIKSALLFAGLLAGSASAAGNTLQDVSVAPTPAGVEVTVKCSEPPVFNVFRLKEPDRLVVDVSNASVEAIKGHHDGNGPVAGIMASQFSDAKAEVGRLLLGLNNAKGYDVKASGNALIISIDGGGAAKPEAVSVAPRQNVAGETIIASRVDEKPVKSPATRLKRIVAEGRGLKLVTDGEVAKFEVIELADPSRVAIDLYGLKGSPRAPKQALANVRDVRVGAHEDKVRVVVEFAQRPNFDVRRRADGVSLMLKGVVRDEVAANDDAAAEVEIDGQKVAIEGATAAASQSAEITDVSFKESASGGVVQLTVKGGAAKWAVERPDGKSAVLNLDGARIARRLERSLDTSALSTPVKMVSVFAVPGATDKVRVVVAGEQALEQVVTERPGVMQWRFSVKGGSEQLVAENRSAGFSTEAEEVAEEGAPQQRRYVGKRVSFEFKDIDIHNLLRIIAEISKKNIVVADDVGGRVTVRLRNVPWDQALDLVLRSKSLGKEEFGNIVRVAPLATLEAEAKSRQARRDAAINSAPLSVTLVPVNYARADEMSARVKEVLSARGNVTVDARTNTMIVRDLPENIGKVRSLVTSLDLQTPQVLIESRIVEASTQFSREVGIQWGGNAVMSPGTGNPTGLVFPSSVGVFGGLATAGGAGNPAQSNYAVSLPSGANGAVGLTFGSAGGAVALNLRLTALENQGALKTISAPRVTTLDNETATISQGVQIPFSQVSAAGANTQFVTASLSLTVTPHITQDGSVLMRINATNNQPDPSTTGANGQPGISTKQANTNVLVKDGETTVIGGIYVRAGSMSEQGLPILSKIPVLGFFFRNHRELENKNELLIFITPRILNRAAVAQNP